MDLSIITSIVAGAAALVLLVDRLVSGRRTEWRDVAESRQQQIADLEKRVTELEAKLDIALDSVFADVIAVKVVAHLQQDKESS